MKKKSSILMHIASNLVLVFLLFSITIVCFMPIDDGQETATEAVEGVYRNASSKSDGVSLMFNVYWGTEEVEKILDILEEFDATCTFFIGGCWADDNVSTLKKIVEKGHELGNHGYFHKDHSSLSESENQKEMATCNEFIYLATGKMPKLFAPPSGAYNEQTVKAARSLEMSTILWSKDTIDWRDKDEATTIARATKTIKGGDFVLMHPMPTTLKALDDILTYYQKEGLRVVTVTENLQVGG